MGSPGSFGYKIGKKTRLMLVQYDADLLWQTCVRELFILLKHYVTLDALRGTFIGLKDAKNKPTKAAIEKCAPYTDLSVDIQSTESWYCLTRHCQHSYINILDTGYILNNGNEYVGPVFMIDFNTNSVSFYSLTTNNNSIFGIPKKTVHETATFDEILGFEDMPTISMTQILDDLKENYQKYSEEAKVLDIELHNNRETFAKLKKEFGMGNELIFKAQKLVDKLEFKREELDKKRRMFYYRLDALNLIDHSTTESLNNIKL